MNKEILFRGKVTGENKWVYGYYVQQFNANEIYCLDDCEFESRYVDPATVSQYIGLLDKNGTKIFEGDIVTGYFNDEKIVGKIVYGSNAEYYIERGGLYGIHLDNAKDWLEIIGNRWDNPELLEED